MDGCKLQIKIIILINSLVTFLLTTNVLLYFYKDFVTPTFELLFFIFLSYGNLLTHYINEKNLMNKLVN